MNQTHISASASVPNNKLLLSEVLGKPTPREKILNFLKKDRVLYGRFLSFSPELREEFLLFCQGATGLKITYDPFFQKMQKVGYAFPSERSECNASDMTMRQYTLVKQERGKNFTFKDMHPVFLIVIMEKSPRAFRTGSNAYIHKRIVSHDTGISLKSLHNILYINLDIFHETVQNITNDMEAWLTFLSSDQPEDILKLVNYNLIFKDMYREMTIFRKDVKEVVNMYSEALSIIDKNTVSYMIEEQQKVIDKQSDL